MGEHNSTKSVRTFRGLRLDPLTYFGAVVMMSVVALLAIAVPALRATRLDPMAVLKGE
jgi:ABC-type antimicrobial peptide transport system permease subunit